MAGLAARLLIVVDRVDVVDLTLDALLSRDVLLLVLLLRNVLRGRLLCQAQCRLRRDLLVNLRIEAVMDLDLAFHPLDDGMTTAFFGPVLGTHLLGGGDGALRTAAKSLLGRGRLVSALAARLSDNLAPLGAVTDLGD